VVTGYDENGHPAVIRPGEPPVVILAGRYPTTEPWVSGHGPLEAADVDTSTREWALEPQGFREIADTLPYPLASQL